MQFQIKITFTTSAQEQISNFKTKENTLSSYCKRAKKMMTSSNIDTYYEQKRNIKGTEQAQQEDV